MEKASHGYGHNVGGVPSRDAYDILVVQTAAFQVLGDANGPGESLSVGDFHALGVRNLWIHHPLEGSFDILSISLTWHTFLGQFLMFLKMMRPREVSGLKGLFCGIPFQILFSAS